MKFRTLILAFLALLTIQPALADKPIEDLVDVPIPARVDNSRLDVDGVKEVIIAGCRSKGWAPVLVDENRFEASIHVRKHFAKVQIDFDTETYSIRYLDSKNLDYDPVKRKIHRNYNKWVILLSEAIQREFATRVQ